MSLRRRWFGTVVGMVLDHGDTDHLTVVIGPDE
ncbi:hypothetical protein B0I32_109176 [Nonomuraea fuscirosea]|uniref:Uncharacterized protein n=1 Tax=Nonomuraea fuscirosea TaxID=1291556 RepID=A0A2T0MYC6_9ACTN|nr:hypothetical protein B0I32_109176 [Nonomuraea fuscirosea]